MSHITAKVLADDDVPCSTMSLIEFFLDMGGNVLLDVVFFEGRVCDIDGFLLELFAHIYVFDDGFGASRDGGDAAGGSVYGGGVWFVIGHGG